MEDFVLSYSKFSDLELLNILKSLLSSFTRTRKQREYKRKLSRKLTNSNSLKLFHNIPHTENSSNPAVKRLSVESVFSKRLSTRATPRSKSSPYSIDQVLTLYNIFNKLTEAYGQTTWVRRSSNFYSEIHVVLFKQFLFDCFLADKNLFSLILEPLSNSLWMGSDIFVTCLEEIHLGARWKFFASKRVKKNENNNLHKEKLIFFAAMIMFEKGDNLDRDSLKKAIDFAEKQNFFQLELLTDFYISKVADDKSGCYNIPFKKIYNVIINLDFSGA